MSNKLRYILWLAAGFIGLSLSRITDIALVSGIAAFVWLGSFLFLVCGYTSRRTRIITGLVFCASYIIRFWGMLGSPWLCTPMFFLVGAIMYS